MAIDPDRLRHIPEEFREQHSFCFWLHDLMVDVMRQAEAARVADVTIRFKDENEKRAFSETDDLIGFFLDGSRRDVAQRIVMNQVVIPLYADMLHFIYEGLKALEKHKYAVAFTLLRKPFKYGLMFATWVFADEDDFFERLRKSPSTLLTDGDGNLSKERRIELLRSAIAGLQYSESFDAETIYVMVYDKKNARSLAPYFDKAAHFVTSHPGIKTEALNLNFIFKNPSDTDIYEGVYFLIAYLLMYLLLLEIETIGRMAHIPGSYRTWTITAALGTFEALFCDGSLNIIDGLNKTWAEIFNCALCGNPRSVTRENALLFFATEHLDCPKCKTEQQFPLFWLMSKFADGKPKQNEETST